MKISLWISVLFASTLCVVFAVDTNKNDKIVKATNCFSTNLIPKLKTKDGNLICSGLSADIVLSMLQMGANGATYDELNQALLYKENRLSKDDVQNEMQSVLKNLRGIKDVTLNIENSLWIEKSFSVKPSYKKVVTDKFLATEEDLDFKNNAHGATGIINNWVKDKTNSLIPKLFDSDLDPGTVLVLVNAIYFKGTWTKKFDVMNTKALPFRNNDNEAESKMVSLMNQQEEFLYVEDPDLQAKVMQMNYKGDAITFVAVLPKEGVSLSDVEPKLNCVKISEVLKSGTMRQVNVTMPKFDIKSDFDLEQPLRDLKINTVFGDADLSGIADGDLHISKIVQKARIKVYEEGSEAAAATGAAAGGGAYEEPEVIEQFNANRPFAFYIVERKSGQILFAGRVTRL